MGASNGDTTGIVIDEGGPSLSDDDGQYARRRVHEGVIHEAWVHMGVIASMGSNNHHNGLNTHTLDSNTRQRRRRCDPNVCARDWCV